MVNKDKMFDLIMRLMNEHRMEEHWMRELDLIDCYEMCNDVYRCPEVGAEDWKGNIIVAFTVMAYTKGSPWLEFQKDRWMNKRNIMARIAGLSANTDPLYIAVVENLHAPSFNLASKYLEYQKDWKFKNIIVNYEYHSMTEAMSQRGAADAQEAIAIGKALREGKQNRMEADEMLKELQKEFMPLDAALEKEGRNKITDMENNNFMRHEQWLARQKRLPKPTA
jgi:hypothetical protein